MLLPRIIPCLLIKNGGLVKTVRFSSPKYVGDPINAVKIFNEKEVDELMVLDIDATAENREPEYSLIEKLAAECRMPLCYGGGVKTVEQIEKIISLGVEKVSLSSAIIDSQDIIAEAKKVVGSQSVVAIADVKKNKLTGTYNLYTEHGQKKAHVTLPEFIQNIQAAGAGEIVINSINRDGTMTGYDMDLISQVMQTINIPVTVLGGAGSIDDIKTLISTFGIIGAAAGSLFVFKGKYRAVLINYPNPHVKQSLLPA